jgi:hypothetical protein
LLLSLPFLLGTTADTIPAEIPYLAADPSLVAKWRAELAAHKGHKIGIAWQGSRYHPEDGLRSFPLAHYEPLALLPGVCLVTLQVGPGSEQAAALAGRFEVLDLNQRLDSAGGIFLEMAAVMRNLDLVITCDTAVAHLAGALGVPTWVALPFAPDWRWQLEREDSPWYPTIRLFRQSKPGDWQGVFERMAQSLSEKLPSPPSAEATRRE